MVAKLFAIILGAVLLGNLFLDEVKKSRTPGARRRSPYLSLPGILVIAVIAIPVALWLISGGK
ncbi:conserved hypothetical protein [Candidatus Desulfarcum epimagneticum]|uniref:Uncharacterized protein n=1 Tax=uncultured Desulfobacteraceae bacterium TaxID=218296 RepID=A0A484HJI3_9BACT|nr:conserved hypothetical protein [uncultured Desulfobacteraceae bacterium]